MSQTLKNLQMHMSETGMSQAALARALDKSTSVVSQYLNGKYTGDVSALERDISAYLARQADRRRAQRVVIPFVSTATAKKINQNTPITTNTRCVRRNLSSMKIPPSDCEMTQNPQRLTTLSDYPVQFHTHNDFLR